MNLNVFSLITSAIANGMPLLFGTTGEILTEKSGNLNLGVEGLMYMGGAFGISGALFYQNLAGVKANGMLMLLIAILCAFLAGCMGALIYCFVTITLKANQNVTGLALTTFGTGVAQFVGEIVKKNNGGNISLNSAFRGVFTNSPFPSLFSNVVKEDGFLYVVKLFYDFVFGRSIFVYLGIILAIAVTVFLKKSRVGLNLRAVGENPGTADAAGINVEKYKYVATIIGGGISAIGGMVYIMTIGGTVWDARALAGEGWIAVALVIFCLWKPTNSLWGSALFGALIIMYIRVPLSFIPSQIYKVLPYIVTVIVLIIVSTRQKREDQPPAALGLSYYREER